MDILLLSDTHGELTKTLSIIKQHPNMDGYFHLGDVGFAHEYIPQCTIVRGNHDEDNFVKEAVFDFCGFHTLLVHGDCFEKMLIDELSNAIRLYKDWDDCLNAIYDEIVKTAKKKGYQAVFFGHTHTACFQKREGIYLCNPGSLLFSHDGQPSSYAILHIDEDGMHCEHFFLD